MRSLKKTRRIQIIVLAFVSLAIATGLIGYAMRDGINFFRSPSQVIAEPPSPSEVFRIGGLVAEGSIVRGQGEEVQFSVTDGGATIPVTFTGILPDLFEENQGMVGTGSYVNGVFQDRNFGKTRRNLHAKRGHRRAKGTRLIRRSQQLTSTVRCA